MQYHIVAVLNEQELYRKIAKPQSINCLQIDLTFQKIIVVLFHMSNRRCKKFSHHELIIPSRSYYPTTNLLLSHHELILVEPVTAGNKDSTAFQNPNFMKTHQPGESTCC